MFTLFGVFLLVLLVIIGIAVIRSEDLFVAATLSGIYSLLMAAVFYLLDAVDVALTEAAVGAGISTVLLLAALSLTTSREAGPRHPRVLALTVVTATTLMLLWATFEKPRLGDPDAPVQVHVAPEYLERTASDFRIPNVVTAVLGSFRGYDTFGEVLVVFTAGIGVLLLLSNRGRRRTAKSPEEVDLRHHLIPKVIGRLVIPFLLLFGLYVQFHGEYGPGGGFQAGALIAAALILYALLHGRKAALAAVPEWVALSLVSGGVLLYGGVGIACMFLGGNFLDYSVLAADPVVGRQVGLILIEAGVGATVTGVMLAIFHAFAGREA